MLMSATALLQRNPHPTEDEVRYALQGNICRCTGYVNIVEAVVAAGGAGAAGAAGGAA
jgi:aerobic-type carbon monoxide dehydrogenase small subunit (CoxS/CutS family)